MNPYVESSSFSLSRLLLFVCLHIKKGWDESKVMVCPINSQFVPPGFLNFVFLLLCFLASHGLVLQVIRKVMMGAYILREELRECVVKNPIQLPTLTRFWAPFDWADQFFRTWSDPFLSYPFQWASLFVVSTPFDVTDIKVVYIPCGYELQLI